MQIFSAGISVPTHLVAAHPDRTELCPHTIHLPAPRPGAHILPFRAGRPCQQPASAPK